MRKLLLPLGWTLANLALQISGYQNPTLAGVVLAGGVISWVSWLVSHDTLLKWCRQRKIMTLLMAIRIGGVIGGSTGAAWWAWKIRPSKGPQHGDTTDFGLQPSGTANRGETKPESKPNEKPTPPTPDHEKRSKDVT